MNFNGFLPLSCSSSSLYPLFFLHTQTHSHRSLHFPSPSDRFAIFSITAIVPSDWFAMSAVKASIPKTSQAHEHTHTQILSNIYQSRIVLPLAFARYKRCITQSRQICAYKSSNKCRQYFCVFFLLYSFALCGQSFRCGNIFDPLNPCNKSIRKQNIHSEWIELTDDEFIYGVFSLCVSMIAATLLGKETSGKTIRFHIRFIPNN